MYVNTNIYKHVCIWIHASMCARKNLHALNKRTIPTPREVDSQYLYMAFYKHTCSMHLRMHSFTHPLHMHLEILYTDRNYMNTRKHISVRTWYFDNTNIRTQTPEHTHTNANAYAHSQKASIMRNNCAGRSKYTNKNFKVRLKYNWITQMSNPMHDSNMYECKHTFRDLNVYGTRPSSYVWHDPVHESNMYECKHTFTHMYTHFHALTRACSLRYVRVGRKWADDATHNHHSCNSAATERRRSSWHAPSSHDLQRRQRIVSRGKWREHAVSLPAAVCTTSRLKFGNLNRKRLRQR